MSQPSSSLPDESGAKELEEIDDLDDQTLREIEDMTEAEMKARMTLMNNEIKIMKLDMRSIGYEMNSLTQRINENSEKLKGFLKLPLLVADVSQICEKNQAEKDSSTRKRSNAGVILKTTFRKTIFLPDAGLLREENVKPGDSVCTVKDTFTLVSSLPKDIDPRVKVMEVIEKPKETYADIGGLEKQIQELTEAITLPLTHREMFDKVGIKPTKGVLLYGPPGTGKTLLAKACAHHTQCTFLRLAGSQLVQSYIGEGAKLVRDAFRLARLKAPAVVFIDELDAVGSKRGGSGRSGNREVHRTLIELLNQLDGIQSNAEVKIIGATNRVDVLDPALLRSGRMDKKIEFPEPDQTARTRVIQIHSKNMSLSPDVDLEELGRSTEGFSCAMCRALCSEAAMSALRRQSSVVTNEDFNEGITEVLARKKGDLSYFS